MERSHPICDLWPAHGGGNPKAHGCQRRTTRPHSFKEHAMRERALGQRHWSSPPRQLAAARPRHLRSAAATAAAALAFRWRCGRPAVFAAL